MSTACTPTLLGPVGLQFAVFNCLTLPTDPDQPLNPDHLPLQALATCYIAFGQIHLTPEEEWTTNTMNEVIASGRRLLYDTLEKNEFASNPRNDVLRNFIICDNIMDVKLSEPIVVGTMQCESSRVYSIIVGLQMFMQKYEHCVCQVKNQFFLMWRRNHSCFLFDCYGRNRQCQRQNQDGCAALICVCRLENIGLILQHMSDFNPKDIYSLYEIELKVILPCCKESTRPFEQGRKQDYQIISKNRACLEGTLHIGHRIFKTSLRKQALPTAISAIIYSKIDPTCTWDSTIVDNVMVFGNKLYQQLTVLNSNKNLAIQDIPANISFGQFTVTIRVMPRVGEGIWGSTSCKVNMGLAELRRIFSSPGVHNLLIKVDKRVYALWKRGDYYYVLDPYQRTIVDAPVEGEGMQATVYMMNSLGSLCSTLDEYVIRLSVPGYFHANTVKVTNIRKENIENLPLADRQMSCVAPEIGRVDHRDESCSDGKVDLCRTF